MSNAIVEVRVSSDAIVEGIMSGDATHHSSRRVSGVGTTNFYHNHLLIHHDDTYHSTMT